MCYNIHGVINLDSFSQNNTDLCNNLEDYTKICPRYHNRKHNDIASYPKGLDNWQFIVYQSIHRNWRDAVPDSDEWRTE